MDGPLEWIASGLTMVSAMLVAADKGRRVTGFGFVLFCAASVTWIVSGMTTGAIPLAATNGVLLLINLYGVWQYLLSAKNRKVMERLEPVAERIEREVEREDAAEQRA